MAPNRFPIPARLSGIDRPAMPRASARRVPALACALALLLGEPAAAASNKVRITNLSDVAFGTILNFGIDAVRSQNLCLFADTNTNGYTITATGTGPGGLFQLANGTAAMAYEVR